MRGQVARRRKPAAIPDSFLAGGPPGPQGAQGPVGNQGPQGAAGPPTFTWQVSFYMTLESATQLRKDAGTPTAWAGAGWSKEGFARGCFVTFRAGQTDKHVLMGLNTDPTADDTYATIDYAWYPSLAGGLHIYESGAYVGPFGAYTVNTVLAITYDGGNIRYWKDGVLMRIVPRAIGAPLFLDSSFYSPDSFLTDIHFGPMGEKGPAPEIIGNYVPDWIVGASAGPGGAWVSTATNLQMNPQNLGFDYLIVVQFSGWTNFIMAPIFDISLDQPAGAGNILITTTRMYFQIANHHTLLPQVPMVVSQSTPGLTLDPILITMRSNTPNTNIDANDVATAHGIEIIG